MIKMAPCPVNVRGKSRYFYLGFFPHHAQYEGIFGNGERREASMSDENDGKMASCHGNVREQSRYCYLGFFPHHAQYDGILENERLVGGYGGVR